MPRWHGPWAAAIRNAHFTYLLKYSYLPVPPGSLWPCDEHRPCDEDDECGGCGFCDFTDGILTCTDCARLRQVDVRAVRRAIRQSFSREDRIATELVPKVVSCLQTVGNTISLTSVSRGVFYGPGRQHTRDVVLIQL